MYLLRDGEQESVSGEIHGSILSRPRVYTLQPLSMQTAYVFRCESMIDISFIDREVRREFQRL